MMPAMFIGHGSPMNAIEDNGFTNGWKDMFKDIPKPRAILAISAHWYTDRTLSTGMENPRTIHDFYGFPDELNKVEYPASGDTELASRVGTPDLSWGLDHGVWSILRKIYPNADIPVVQLSVNRNLSPKEHYELGKSLIPLRDEDILIMGSGNIVHNLSLMRDGPPFDWAKDFDDFVKEKLSSHDDSAIIGFENHASSRKAQPTIEHFLPLLYVLGASNGSEPKFFTEQFQYGSVSMRSVLYQ